ncbi:MAG: thioredoxin fold domain-containing protein [Acidobacteria bacterium]|nr:thioredoxin fold domain-containing protein [Acidobacteriota bacterium]
MDFLFYSNIALWVAFVLQALFILALFRYIGYLLERVPPEGLPLGQKPPRREVEDLDGAKHILGEPSPRPRVLIFTAPGCPWCEKLAPEIAPFAQSVAPTYDVFVIVMANQKPEDARKYIARIAQNGVVKGVVAPHLMEPYKIVGTPYAIVLDEEGLVRSKGVTNTLTDLQTLIILTSSR